MSKSVMIVIVKDKNFLTFGKKEKKLLQVFSLVFFTAVVPFLFFWYFNYAINRPSQTFRDIDYNLRSSKSLNEIGKELFELGVINSENLFNIYVRLTRSFPSFKEGIYTFESGSSLVEVVNQMKRGTNGVAITFIEGKRVEEYGLLASNIFPSFNYENFIFKTKGLEGRLFPDTYFFYASANEDDVISVMKSNFEKKWEVLKKTEEYQNSTLRDEEIFILASLIEKESAVSSERRVIAGIIMNRLQKGEILGIDASNQYLSATYDLCQGNSDPICPSFAEASKVDWWKKDLTKRDLSLDSPYNLRIKTRLPPTPISSFSLDSLKAAISPQKTDFLYYLHDKNGSIRFAKTLEEHNRNIELYLSN